MWNYFLDPKLIFANAFVLVPQIIHYVLTPDPPIFDINFNILFSFVKYSIFYYF